MWQTNSKNKLLLGAWVPVYDCMIPFYITRYDISVLSCHANTTFDWKFRHPNWKFRHPNWKFRVAFQARMWHQYAFVEYTESIMQYTSNQHKSIQDFTYIHTKGPSASYLALLAISDIPHRVGRDIALSPVYLYLRPIMITHEYNRNLSRLLHIST